MLPREKRSGQSVRVLALDYGRAHTGAAISDPTGTIVRPLEVIKDAGTPDGIKRTAAMVRNEGAGTVVVGIPVSLSGEMGVQARETYDFIRALETHLKIPVRVWDERFTSRIATARGRYSTASRHSLAACVILEDYLGSQAFQNQE